MSGASLRFIVAEIERTPEPLCPDPFIAGLEREAERGPRGRCPANDSRSSRGSVLTDGRSRRFGGPSRSEPVDQIRDCQDEPNPDELR